MFLKIPIDIEQHCCIIILCQLYYRLFPEHCIS